MSSQCHKSLPPPPLSRTRHLPDRQHVVSPLEEYTSPAAERRPSSRRDADSVDASGNAKSAGQYTGKRPPSPRTSWSKIGVNWWPWEWLCELLALGSLAAMILVLMHFHDKPQAEWRQSYFTLNGLIAFLATLTKTGLIIPVSAAIGQRKWLRFLPNQKVARHARKLGDFEMFDEASRGSLGSAKMLFSLNLLDVACLGAFITIVSVFFSAITQNVLGTYESMQDGRSLDLVAGRVPRSEHFILSNQPRASELTFEQRFMTDVTTLAAIYNGIMSDQVDDVPISCATGNCTWPTIPTAGMCGACMDMKDEVLSNCGGGAGDQEGCYFSIPGGMNLTKPISLAHPTNTTPLFVAGPGSDFIFNRTDIVGEGDIREKMSFNFIGQSYSQFVNENLGSWIPSNRTLFNRANVLAYECGLWHCIQSRSVNASNGVVHDTMLDFRNGQAPPDNDGTIALTERPFRFLEEPSFNIDNIKSYDLTSREDYAIYGLKSALVLALGGSISIDGYAEVQFTATSLEDSDIGYSYNAANGLAGSAADCLQAAWVYADNIEEWWARLAKSLTNNIRVNGALRQAEHDRYTGIAWTEVVHIEVRWLWLIFPVSLVLLSTLFLVATIIASCRIGLKPWKSCIMPVLYSRLEEGLQEEWKREHIGEGSVMADVKDRWAGLDNYDGDWIFGNVSKDSLQTKQAHYAGDTSADARLGAAE